MMSEDQVTTKPKSHTRCLKGDAHLTTLIEFASFAPDPRWEAIQRGVQGLTPFDDRCLLAFLLGYKSGDSEFLTVIAEWLESNRAMNARIQARLQGPQ
jgi:hypothetical protein